jgi:hypothetical protein
MANKLRRWKVFHYLDEQMSRTFDPVQLGSIEVFCKAAELGGFTTAAESLGLGSCLIGTVVPMVQ